MDLFLYTTGLLYTCFKLMHPSIFISLSFSGISRLIADMKQGFTPREALTLELVYSIISHCQSLQIEMNPLWPNIFDILSFLLNKSKQPMSHIWCLAIMQELDLLQPSRESFITDKKNVKRDLTELARSISTIGAKQFHLKHSTVFDLSPPLPPTSVVLLEKLQAGIETRFREREAMKEEENMGK